MSLEENIGERLCSAGVCLPSQPAITRHHPLLKTPPSAGSDPELHQEKGGDQVFPKQGV